MSPSGLGRGLRLGLAGLAGLPTLAVASELRVGQAVRPLSKAWRRVPVAPRGPTRLGISFRSPQLAAFGLDDRATLAALLAYPFEVIRLGAYWRRIEPAAGRFEPAELDAQVEAAEAAGKDIILCVGALKTFGYPEFFAPAHVSPSLPEGRRIRAAEYPALLTAATEFIARVIERYRSSSRVVAWQVEHEAVDPLGMEHSWRLDVSFVEAEVRAARRADPGRPILMNGYLPGSLAVGLSQWWQTRDQGDSLAVAQQLADIVGIDYYPRHALVGTRPASLYLDGTRSPWHLRRLDRVLAWAGRHGKRVLISEGQAEPWEAVTVPPSPSGQVPASCPPQALIQHYNRCLGRARRAGVPLEAYLFWGAEYWMRRQRDGDPSYLQAFARVLDGG